MEHQDNSAAAASSSAMTGSLPQQEQSKQAATSTTTTTTTTSSTSSSQNNPATILIPPTFTRRKATILSHLALPDEEYTDLSPKGTVDAGIRELIDVINGVEGLVTTSSCAGRVSVFLEGRRKVVGGSSSPSAASAMAVAATGGGTGGASAGARPNAPRPGSGRDYGSGGVPGNDGGGQLPSHQFVDPFDDSEQQEVLGDGRDDGTMVSAAATGSGGGGRVPPPAAGANGERLATVAGVGGKGGGGRWLFVSHEPVVLQGKLDSEPNIVGALLGMDEPIFDGREGAPAVEMSDGESRLIHFKFEPMILHVLTASLHHAQRILSCGLQAGFRESGAINLLPSASASASATPIVAIRSMGLGLESLIGRETNGIKHCTVSGDYLTALIRIANERFAENAARIERFRRLLVDAFGAEAGAGFALTPTPAGGRRRTGVGEGGGSAWEDAAVRRERKRLEGLARAEEVRRAKLARKKDGDTDGDVDGVGDGVDVDV